MSPPVALRRLFRHLVPESARIRLREWRGVGLFGKFADEHHAVFIHIPKTAGVSVRRALSIDHTPSSVHATYLDYQRADPRKCRDYFKFAFVRDPFDRVLSAYSFLAAGGIERFDARRRERVLHGIDGFEQFVHERLPRVTHELHFRPQHEFLCDGSGTVKVDFVGRVETMDHDFAAIRDRLGIDGELAVHNSSVHEASAQSYTTAMRAIVGQLYARDFSLFGYDPDR
ncbi:sulfotransferase family protein [Iodidimonas sp. SYSU 1G8]|uniref:sulfotransferase family protein n=1 Tax=Iodidimonas sp. SYSU 1G8 TaxID=3133967 RepID=UPI0031FEE913